MWEKRHPVARKPLPLAPPTRHTLAPPLLLLVLPLAPLAVLPALPLRWRVVAAAASTSAAKPRSNVFLAQHAWLTPAGVDERFWPKKLSILALASTRGEVKAVTCGGDDAEPVISTSRPCM